MKGAQETHLHTLGHIAETKRIFTAIQTATGEKDHFCLVVTSGSKGEGKTTVASGLALAAASIPRKKVLLVDYNWFAPTVHSFFGVELLDSPGAFYKADSLDQIIVSTESGVDVLPAVHTHHDFDGATPTSAEYDHRLIEEARHRYDTIIVDTASAYPENQWMKDPVLLSSMADGVVLVFLTNMTPRSTLKRTVVAIQTQGANLLGVVANQWKNPITPRPS